MTEYLPMFRCLNCGKKFCGEKPIKAEEKWDKEQIEKVIYSHMREYDDFKYHHCCDGQCGIALFVGYEERNNQ